MQTRTKFFGAFVLLCCLLQPLHAGLPQLIPYYTDGKWGYSDSTGRMIIAARYDSCEMLRNGLGVISQLKPQSSRYGNDNMLYGLVDSSGKILFEPQFQTKPRTRRGPQIVALWREGNFVKGIIDHHGHILLDFAYNPLDTLPNNLFFSKRRAQNLATIFNVDDPHNVIKLDLPGYRSRYAPHFVNGYATIVIDSIARVINRNLEDQVDTIYKNPRHAVANYFFVGRDSAGVYQEACINSDGDQVVPFDNYKLSVGADSIIVAVFQQKRLGRNNSQLFNLQGEKLYPDGFEVIRDLGQSRLLARESASWRIIDSNGDSIDLSKYFNDINIPLTPYYGNKLVRGGFLRSRSAAPQYAYFDLRGTLLPHEPDRHSYYKMFDHRFNFFDQELEGWPNDEVRKRIMAKVDTVYGFSEGWDRI